MANGLGSASMLSPLAGAASFGALGPAALFAFAPSLLSKLFGGDPQKKYRKQVGQLTSPQNISKLTSEFYRNALMSPAFAQAQGGIAAGANQTQQGLAQALAQRGLGTTGAGAILGSAIPSITAQQLGGLRTSAYGGAQQQAMARIQQQLAALQGTTFNSQTGGFQSSPTQQHLAGGLEAFGPMLAKWLKGKYPGMF